MKVMITKSVHSKKDWEGMPLRVSKLESLKTRVSMVTQRGRGSKITRKSY
jgi:hypothetical protein